MTNPKTRKARKTATRKPDERSIESAERLQLAALQAAEEAETLSDIPIWMQQQFQETSNEEEDISTTPTPSCNLNDEQIDEEDVADSNTSFSLQECMNEFRARRLRRISAQSREEGAVVNRNTGKHTGINKICAGDADLINQNLSNKEQERLSKPCRNGFCYCFTSDSGDAGFADGRGLCAAASTAARGIHVRNNRRNRKSEGNQMYHSKHCQQHKEDHRRSAPSVIKTADQNTQTETLKPKQGKSRISATTAATTVSNDQLKAVSRLTTSSADAPLIHIIQELHNNCVISEVRINKHKVQQAQRSQRSIASAASMQQETLAASKGKIQNSLTCQYKNITTLPKPSAPTLEEISEYTSEHKQVETIPTDSSFIAGGLLQAAGPRQRHKSGGLLLKKRLSRMNSDYKPKYSLKPPPKPPRLGSIVSDDKLSDASLTSTTPSLKEAERILDEFLRRRGFQIPESKFKKPQKNNAEPENRRRENRKSFPLTQLERTKVQKPARTYPSLSELEHLEKFDNNYEKNIRYAARSPIKEVRYGWHEPKIVDMLNYDRNGNQKEFKSKAVQAEPQTLGWQVPHKIELDTVDGAVGCNLASNIEKKETPIKTRLFSAQKEKPSQSQKFIWSEQWRNLSPWANKSANNTNRKNNQKSPCDLLKKSKKKILRLVSPKKSNKSAYGDCSTLPERKPTEMRSVAVQTTREDIVMHSYEPSSTPQSPPGSYDSAVQTSHRSTTQSTSPNCNETRENTQFDFSRVVMSPPRKSARSTQRKLNFPLSCVSGVRNSDAEAAKNSAKEAQTYRSYHSDLDQDATLSKMGYILSNIRAKLEASDKRAEQTFKETEGLEQISQGFDYPDSHGIRAETSVSIHAPHRSRRSNNSARNIEPIYSEIEEESILISGSPNYESTTGVKETTKNFDELYAKVNKKNKVKQSEFVTPMPLGKILHDSLKDVTAKASSMLLAPLPELPSNIDAHYTSDGCHKKLPHCQSLNNIRVMEHHSPPKKNRNLSKSDLSLHRSEIFLDNLCCSEIVTDAKQGTPLLKKYENTENQRQNISMISDSEQHSCISYELPLDEVDEVALEDNNLGLSVTELPVTENQSTPKKEKFKSEPQNFITKVEFYVDSY